MSMTRSISIDIIEIESNEMMIDDVGVGYTVVIEKLDQECVCMCLYQMQVHMVILAQHHQQMGALVRILHYCYASMVFYSLMF